MSRTAHKLLSASGGEDAYEIDQSLMFGEDANSYIYKNYGSAGTSRKTWTFSAWVKRSHVQTGHADSNKGNILFSAWDNSTNTDTEYFALNFYTDKIYIGGYNTNWRITNRLFRDAASWFHLCLAIDTTQSTANDRVKLYINGVQETSFSTTNNPTQDSNTGIGSATWTLIGAINASGTVSWYKGYVAEVHYVDGTALTPSSFGETDAVTGQWIPKKYTGSYGNNGVYLKLASGAIGTDSSGNGNTWSTSSMGNSDVLLDTPTNNHCTVNPVDNSGNLTATQGNTKFHSSDTNRVCFKGTMGVTSGKWYYEYTDAATSSGSVGVVNASATSLTSNGMVGNSSYGWAVNNDGAKENGNSETASYMSGGYTTNDVIGVALNMDDGEITFYKNGSSAGVAFSNLSGKGAIFPAVCTGSNSGAFDTLNFGQMSFAHTPPTGYKAWNTSNLPDPTVKKSSDHFNTVLYTGSDDDSVSQSVTGVGFQPDLVWIKKRNGASHHVLVDAVRGDEKALNTSQDAAEVDDAYGVEAFGTDGFTVREHTTAGGQVNTGTLVAWNWKANGSGSSNSDGAQTTTVSANTTSGFSIVTGTGTGSSTTYGHGLGVEPKIVVTKSRSATGNWIFYTSGIDGIPYNTWQYAYLDTDDDFDPASEIASNTTTFSANYTNGVTFVSYCFAEVEGFSKFAIYEGNGSTDGPFINLGFTPAWVIIRNQADGEWWWMLDSTRDTTNLTTEIMYTNATSAESSIGGSGGIDMLSNGFKIRGSNSGMNGSGQIMFYMAFAEFPLKYANAR